MHAGGGRRGGDGGFPRAHRQGRLGGGRRGRTGRAARLLDENGHLTHAQGDPDPRGLVSWTRSAQGPSPSPGTLASDSEAH